MAVNPYLNNFHASNEQELFENLLIESIQFHGMDVLYLPKKHEAKDKIYGEDTLTHFDDTYRVEMYIESNQGFGGQGDFFSKFSPEVRDTLELTVAKKRFREEVTPMTNLSRPMEGDLIYFPLNKKMFRIQYANEKAIFFQLGALQSWKLTLELYEYSHERFDTGIPEIDYLNELTAPTTQENITIFNNLDDSTEIQAEADSVINFDEKNPFGDY